MSFSVSLARSIEPPPRSHALEHLGLVGERDLIARDLLDQAADLLGDERADAEDDREGDADHDEHGWRVGQSGAAEQAHGRRQHERQDYGERQGHQHRLPEIERDDDEEGEDRHLAGPAGHDHAGPGCIRPR